MQGTRKGGYNKKISKFVVDSFAEDKRSAEDVVLDVDEALARKYATALQSAWRSRTARILVAALKQEANCKHHRNTHPELIDNGTILSITQCDKCMQGHDEAEVQEKVCHRRYQEVERLLFTGHSKMTVNDSGDNWNQRFQRIIALPESSPLERSMKYTELYALNKDFVNTATSYAQTIISEYFLHVKDKSIVAKSMGGIAGGQKYLWRGILFKMSSGSSGPYNGSDEAASKAAGHDLKGAIHYYGTTATSKLCVPLMALIDYKGFRMSAQAFLPLGKNSLVYGSADAGRTVLKSNREFNAVMEAAARDLNIRGHLVGGVGDQKELHAAVDIEGHVGMDNRFYLLDLSRTFPPEAPLAAKHLDDVLEDGSTVLVKVQNPSNPLEYSFTKGTVNRAYSNGLYYDILFPDGSAVSKVSVAQLNSRKLSIFWRLLRPEYVHHRGSTLIPLKEEDITPIDSKSVLSELAAPDPADERNTVSAVSPIHTAVTTPTAVRSGANGSANGDDSHGVVSCVLPPGEAVSYQDTTNTDNGADALSPDGQMSTEYDAFDCAPVSAAGAAGDSNVLVGDSGSGAQEINGRLSAEYDAFDTVPQSTMSISRLSEQYDEFDASSEHLSSNEQLASPSTATSAIPSATGGIDETVASPDVDYDPYGVFDDPGAMGDLPDAVPLASTPSTIRMRRNSRFETTNFDEIVAYLHKYAHYDPSALEHVTEEERKTGVEESAAQVPSLDLIKQRQQYIDSMVSELYGEDTVASTIRPFSREIVTVKTRESRRIGLEFLTSCTEPTPAPLSPDALTAFSNFDPEAVDRNREVIRASERLVKEVVPALAQLLAEMPPSEVNSVDVSVLFHYHGVNIRHIGLVRSHIPASSKTTQIRTMLLKQIIVRTLKNICRDFQRRWMRSEQSSSDQGMFLLLTQFLNLIVGCHENSEKFWEEKVTVGIVQRYGRCAIDGNTSHMHRLRKVPDFLKQIVELFLSIMCIRLRSNVSAQFLRDKNPYGFEFVAEDIERIEPRVKYMHVVDYISGCLMQEKAEARAELRDADPRIISRLRSMAGEHFRHAEKTLPLHRETCSRADVMKDLNEVKQKITCVLS